MGPPVQLPHQSDRIFNASLERNHNILDRTMLSRANFPAGALNEIATSIV
jgi:hypothetical protein